LGNKYFCSNFRITKHKVKKLGIIHKYGYKLIPMYLTIMTFSCLIFYFLSAPLFDYAVLSTYLTKSPQYLSFYNNEHYSIINLFFGFLLVFLIGLQLSVFVGGILAINLSEFSTNKFIAKSRSIIELFTNIPFIVYGYLLILVCNEFIDFTNQFNNIVFSGLILGIMMLPMMISKFIYILQSIPYDQREGAYSLGATRYKTAFMVLIPSQLKLFLSTIITILTRIFCEILILLVVTGIIMEKIEVIISIFVTAIVGTWISQLFKKSHYKNGAI
jgi:phosphate transport system permease protein